MSVRRAAAGWMLVGGFRTIVWDRFTRSCVRRVREVWVPGNLTIRCVVRVPPFVGLGRFVSSLWRPCVDGPSRSGSDGNHGEDNMRRRFAHYIAQILVGLAIVLPPIPVATAQSADAVLRTLAPSSARPGDEILIEGAGVLPSAVSGSISSTIRYGDAANVIRGDLASSDWSNTRVRVRLPADIGPGVY